MTVQIKKTPMLHIPAKGKIKGNDAFLESLESAVFSTSEETGEKKLKVDIFETAAEFIFLIPLAGMDTEKVTITLSEEVLTIAGERVFPEEIFEEERNAFLEECSWGKFSRSIVLPENVDAEAAVAKFKNGILHIRIPKVQKPKSKVIPIEMS